MRPTAVPRPRFLFHQGSVSLYDLPGGRAGLSPTRCLEPRLESYQSARVEILPTEPHRDRRPYRNYQRACKVFCIVGQLSPLVTLKCLSSSFIYCVLYRLKQSDDSGEKQHDGRRTAQLAPGPSFRKCESSRRGEYANSNLPSAHLLCRSANWNSHVISGQMRSRLAVK